MRGSQLDPDVPPAFRNPSHFGGTPGSSWPCFSISPKIHYLYYRLALKPSAACLNLPSCTRAPAGYPRSVANRKSAVSLHSLSAHLRRQVQPHRRLLSRKLQTCSESDGELGERLHFASQISAEEGRETVLFLARNRPRAPRRGASIRREMQALFQRPWNIAQRIGSGCWSHYGKRAATVVFAP